VEFMGPYCLDWLYKMSGITSSSFGENILFLLIK
jgi:hypothetical protein